MNLKNEIRQIAGDLVEWSNTKDYVGQYQVIDYPYLIMRFENGSVTLTNIVTEKKLYFLLDYLKRYELNNFINVLQEAKFI